jgi:tRNA A-37 threonylcarbamoyl transferase component Bud32
MDEALDREKVMTPPHPSSEQLTAYALGNLTWGDLDAVESHLAGCPACRSQLAALDESEDSFVACLRQESAKAAKPAEDAGLEHLLAVATSLPEATVTAAREEPAKLAAGHEVIRELARGGLGVVYLARHAVLNDLRAIKRPQPREDVDKTLLMARFRREVEAVGKLRHDHIVRAHDAGVDDDGPYLVMEYLDGVPLSQLPVQRQLSAAQTCALVRQAALGLQAAHEGGLVHRDIKPSNLMLVRAGAGARVVIIDWGLVKRAGEPVGLALRTDSTRAGATMGTADYIAPEQVRDARSVDIRADLYSLGVTFYFLLAGKPPFAGRSELEKLLAHERDPLPSLKQVRPDVPAEVLPILDRLVAKDPARRFATPAELVKALQPYCDSDAALLGLLDGVEPLPALPVPKGRPWRLAWLLLLLVPAALCPLLILFTAVGWMWLGKTKHDANPPPGPEPVVVSAPAVLGDGPTAPVGMKGHAGLCLSIVFTPDGKLAVSESGGGEFFVWDLRGRTLLEKHPHGLEQVQPNQAGVVAVSPDGRFLTAAAVNPGVNNMNFLRLYDQQTRKGFLDKAFPLDAMNHAVVFSPDGSKLAVGMVPGLFGVFALKPAAGHVRIVEVETHRHKQHAVNFPVTSLAFSPDGTLLVEASKQKLIRLWDLEKNTQEEFPGHEGGADQVAFSADGKQVFSASSAEETLRVWDRQKHEVGWKLHSARTIPFGSGMARMTCCAFWPGGRALTGHSDGNVVLWDLEQAKEIWRHTHTTGKATAAALSPDGNHAVTALSDRVVYLYRLPAVRALPGAASGGKKK